MVVAIPASSGNDAEKAIADMQEPRVIVMGRTVVGDLSGADAVAIFAIGTVQLPPFLRPAGIIISGVKAPAGRCQ